MEATDPFSPTPVATENCEPSWPSGSTLWLTTAQGPYLVAVQWARRPTPGVGVGHQARHHQVGEPVAVQVEGTAHAALLQAMLADALNGPTPPAAPRCGATCPSRTGAANPP